MPEEDLGSGCSSLCHYLSSHAQGSTQTIMPHSGEEDKGVEEVEEEEEVLGAEEGEEQGWGRVNKGLTQDFPFLDSCTLRCTRHQWLLELIENVTL